MVLTFTNTTSLDDLAQLADQIMEVATPSISNVTVSTEVEQLHSESRPQETSTVIARLQSMTSSPITLLPTITQSFSFYTKQGNMLVSSTLLEVQHINVNHSVTCQETCRPATNSSEFDWPISKLLILYYRSRQWIIPASMYWYRCVVPPTNNERKHQQDVFTL